MYRVILIDDEPLILAGIASLINWEENDCVIVGKSTIATQAKEMFLALNPDIIITDIRMPVMNGLELIEACKREGCQFEFIVLTNLEEFNLARKALTLGAVDYLVKLNLSPDDLCSTLERAKKRCQLSHKDFSPAQGGRQSGLESVRLYLRQIIHARLTSDILIPDVAASSLFPHPFVVLFSLCPNHVYFHSEEDPYDFCSISNQIEDIVVKISDRFFSSSILMEYDGKNTYLLTASLKETATLKTLLSEFVNRTTTALTTYFELGAVYGASQPKASLSEIPDALSEARTALEYYYYNSSSPLVIFDHQSYHVSQAKNFNINFFKKDLAASVQQNDSSRLRTIFQQIIDLFSSCMPRKEQAITASNNIFTYPYCFFAGDKEDYQDIFPYTINIADQLGHFNCLSDILKWLESFCEKLCTLLSERKETRSDTLVEQAKAFINSHYSEKLALADVSEHLNISSGHLSNTFKKYTGVTISDYIASVKIEHAKELIDTHKYLMYEISDLLGFENPYYFSKVFKKVTGIAPREYENRSGYRTGDY